MTLRRLIWLIVSVILILTPVQLQQNIPIPLAILCVSVGCFIGSYPDIVVCMRVWKKEGLSLKRNRAIIETIIYEVIWTAILVFDFVFHWFGRERILIPTLLGIFLAAYFIYTRPFSAEDMAGKNPFVSVRILKREGPLDLTETPRSSEASTANVICIFTQAPSELQSVAQFLNQYPVNRKRQLGISSHTNSVEDSCEGNEGILLEIHLYYEDSNGSLDAVTYCINSQGDMHADGFPCGIGRFGQRNQAFYEALLRLFAEKSHSPLWEVSS